MKYLCRYRQLTFTFELVEVADNDLDAEPVVYGKEYMALDMLTSTCAIFFKPDTVVRFNRL